MLFGLDSRPSWTCISSWTKTDLYFRTREPCQNFLRWNHFFGRQRPWRVFASRPLSFLFSLSPDSTLCEFLLNKLSHFRFLCSRRLTVPEGFHRQDSLILFLSILNVPASNHDISWLPLPLAIDPKDLYLVKELWMKLELLNHLVYPSFNFRVNWILFLVWLNPRERLPTYPFGIKSDVVQASINVFCFVFFFFFKWLKGL